MHGSHTFLCHKEPAKGKKVGGISSQTLGALRIEMILYGIFHISNFWRWEYWIYLENQNCWLLYSHLVNARNIPIFCPHFWVNIHCRPLKGVSKHKWKSSLAALYVCCESKSLDTKPTHMILPLKTQHIFMKFIDWWKLRNISCVLDKPRLCETSQ